MFDACIHGGTLRSARAKVSPARRTNSKLSTDRMLPFAGWPFLLLLAYPGVVRVRQRARSDHVPLLFILLCLPAAFGSMPCMSAAV